MEGGYGFKVFSLFNDALLAKQAWRLAYCPEFLVSQIFKAKYYPESNFSEASIGRRPSWAWRSILASKHMLSSGMEGDLVPQGSPNHNNNSRMKFSVRKAYEYLLNKETESDRNLRGEPSDPGKLKRFWNKVWRVKAQEKVKILIWRLYYDAIPSAINLVKRGCQVDTRCARCGFKHESTTHIFLECWWAVDFWRSLLCNHYPIVPQFQSMADWLWFCVEKFSGEMLSLIFYGVRWIWFARNHLWHTSNFMSVTEAVSKAKAAASVVLNPRYKFVVSSEEAAHVWCPPVHGSYKFNCDGSWDSRDMAGGFGVICRDCSGEAIFVEAGWLDNVGGIVEVEGAALLKGMQAAERLQCRRAIFAVDNAEVLLAIQRGSRCIGVVEQWRSECQKLLEMHEEWRLEHIFREANLVADFLAQKARLSKWSWNYAEAMPLCIGDLVRHDSMWPGLL